LIKKVLQGHFCQQCAWKHKRLCVTYRERSVTNNTGKVRWNAQCSCSALTLHLHSCPSSVHYEQWRTDGGGCLGGSNGPRNSEVLTKLSRILRSV
jgi:hypothetical protein